jgi:hypothetical protein
VGKKSNPGGEGISTLLAHSWNWLTKCQCQVARCLLKRQRAEERIPAPGRRGDPKDPKDLRNLKEVFDIEQGYGHGIWKLANGNGTDDIDTGIGIKAEV